MADQNDPQPGDNTNNLLLKILRRLDNLSVSGGGGGTSGPITIDPGDVEIGAVELKNGADDTRAVITTGTPGGSDAGLVVRTPALPLPTGASTEATLAAFSAKVTACNTGAVVISSSALPAGASTEATLAALSAKVTAVNTGAVVISSSALPTGASTEVTLAALSAKVTAVNTGAVVISSSALPTGAATEVTLAALSTKVTACNTGAVVISSGAVTATLPASTTVIGNVGGKMAVIKDTTAVTAAGYSAGNAVGGKRTFANALTAVGTGVLESVTILDRANQSAAMTLIIFDADPTNATITDKSAFVYSTDDLKVLGQINIAASDYTTLNSKAVATIRGIGLSLKSAGTSIFAALVTTGTPTFAATTDVQLILGILQD